MSESRSLWRTWHYIILWIIVILSLTINILLLAGLYSFRQRAQTEVTRVNEILDSVQIDNFDLPIKVDETLPLSMSVAFSDTFQVPISATVPVSTSIVVDDNLNVPINETVRIDRDVRVAAVILGQEIPVDIPIRADIPIALNLDVPVDLEVPVDTEIPINLMVDVPVQTEIPVDTEVPIQLEFPVTIPLDQLGFNALLTEVKEGLKILGEILGADVSR